MTFRVRAGSFHDRAGRSVELAGLFEDLVGRKNTIVERCSFARVMQAIFACFSSVVAWTRNDRVCPPPLRFGWNATEEGVGGGVFEAAGFMFYLNEKQL
jgi:hypothetical protein